MQIKHKLQKKQPMNKINYIYFAIYFLLLAIMSASGIFIKDYFDGTRLFFFSYAIGQAIFETAVLILFAHFLEKKAKKWIFNAFIGLTFFLLVLHIIDFILDRILEQSVWYTISFVLDESFSNFLFLLDASGIPLWAWIFMFAAIAALPFIGIGIYKGLNIISEKKPLTIPFEYIPITIFCVPLALFFWDISASRIIHPNTYTAFLEALPWKFTLIQPQTIVLDTAHPIMKTPEETSVVSLLDQSKINITHKPNIYLFVVESFRSDFINSETAPNLFKFKQFCAPSTITVSNANATHQSWYSIFHSQYSYNWKIVEDNNWKIGSAPLKHLKDLGYKIHLYTSAQLGYYGMEKLLFGENQYLLDTYKKFHHAPPVSAAITDKAAIDTLIEDVQSNKNLHQGQVFIIFWDSTHFDYAWPKNWAPKFTPFANELAYFKTFYSNTKINMIKNRYRNSVNYVDYLFGNFWENIPNNNEAVIVVTGDHGEEFFENGHLFHGSHLSQQQTSIPILMKFGQSSPQKTKPLLTQIDIFPSIIDHITGHTPAFMKGESVFQSCQNPFTLITRFNAGRTPFEFCLHNGKYKLTARFMNEKNIFDSESIKIMTIKTFQDKDSNLNTENLPLWIYEEFGKSITHFFPTDL